VSAPRKPELTSGQVIDDGWLEVARILWEGGQGTEDVREILEWVRGHSAHGAEELAPLLPAMEVWEAAAGAR
jgi:hypothetical protein